MFRTKSKLLTFTFILASSFVWAGENGNCEDQLTEKIQKEIDVAMRVANFAPDAIVASKIILDMIKIYPQLRFDDFEISLRRQDSPIYLLARPARFVPMGHTIALPVGGGKSEPRGYFLWVEVNGKEEALRVMEEFGILTESENLRLLRQDTGVLVRRRH
jgi:hypothetical protein